MNPYSYPTLRSGIDMADSKKYWQHSKRDGFWRNPYDHNIVKKYKLPEVLKRELGDKNLTKLGKEIGISPNQLHEWIRARRSPSAKSFPQLLLLAEYLGMTLEELIFDNASEEKSVLASTTFSDDGATYRVAIEKLKRGKK